MDYVQNRPERNCEWKYEFNWLVRTRFNNGKYRICSGVRVIKLSLKSNSSIDFIISIPMSSSNEFWRIFNVNKPHGPLSCGHTGTLRKWLDERFKCFTWGTIYDRNQG